MVLQTGFESVWEYLIGFQIVEIIQNSLFKRIFFSSEWYLYI